ncbi:hypothetical protein LOK49_LG04G02486 [Camellia lanceoleosa]|uniref:Uncharacterized protein n=1 Tax=Camellia lanceoleosa TaxID=1840588 RepID=A0ACC0I1P3_9ERIC|nr:hypothetical protein LOK49_LG04G02486 [Camellia lanceoleosa]
MLKKKKRGCREKVVWSTKRKEEVLEWSQKSGFISGYYRSLSSFSSSNALSDDLNNIVLVEGKAWSRTAILNRPSILNALNTAVRARLRKLYKSWEDNPDIGFVVLKGRGRAFCAGGDIITLCHLINEGIIGCYCSSTLSSRRNFQTSWLVFESHRGQNMTGKLENSTTNSIS